MREFRYIAGVTTLRYDESRCTGCGMCYTVCPRRIFSLENGIAKVKDRDLCIECGGCVKNCATGALSVDKGVGCAYAVILGKVKGSPPECRCDEGCC